MTPASGYHKNCPVGVFSRIPIIPGGGLKSIHRSNFYSKVSAVSRFFPWKVSAFGCKSYWAKTMKNDDFEILLLPPWPGDLGPAWKTPIESWDKKTSRPT